MSIPQKYYQPSLVWALFSAYAKEHYEIDDMQQLKLLVYHASEPGAWYMRGPKLYWDREPSDGQYANTDQADLQENADQLGEVVAMGLGKRHETTLLARDFDAFIDLLTEKP